MRIKKSVAEDRTTDYDGKFHSQHPDRRSPNALLLWVFLLFSTITAPAARAQAPVDGLWLHHRYNEGSGTTAVDASGNGNTGQLHGPSWVSGQAGSALSLDGVDDYLEIPATNLGEITSAITISAWVYLPSSPPEGWYGIVTRQVGETANEHLFLGLYGGSPQFTVSNASGESAWEPGTDLSTNAWHHLVGTYDGNHVKLYVDGSLLFSNPLTGALLADTTPLIVGGNTNFNESPSALLPGYIDNLRIYSRAVAAGDVEDLASEANEADATAPSAPSNLAASAVSSSQINLTWTAATDNVGVTQYLLERCLGVSCSNFAQIATTSGTSYNNTGLAAATSYSYRVRARDAANNLGAYSGSDTEVTQSASSAAPTNGLRLHHRYNEGSGTTAADASGNGNSGQLHGPAWVTGQTGSALSFDGIDDYVEIAATNLGAITTGLTVSAWIYLPATLPEGWYGIVTRQKGVSADEHLFLGMFGGGPHFFVETDAGGSYWEALPNLSPNVWHHLVGTYDGSSLKLYVDGGLVFSTPHTGAIQSDTTPLIVGGNTNYDESPGAIFPGRIDNVRLYDRAVSVAEVELLASEANSGDSVAPSAPGNLSAVAASSSQIDLSWTASTDNVGVTGYLVERCQGSGCSSFSQIAAPSAASYSDTGRTASTNYSYRVRATDASNNLSGYSNTDSETTQSGVDTTPPSTPTGLSVTPGTTSMNLSWSASSDDVAVVGYLIQRCQGAGCTAYTQIGTTTGTSYADTSILAGVSYSYRVVARDAANNEATSSGAAGSLTNCD